MAETTELEYLKKELEENENIVSFALFYDRKNKKFLAVHHGDDAIIEKMLDKAATSNGYFASKFSRISKLFSSKIPKPPESGVDDILGIFDKFRH